MQNTDTVAELVIAIPSAIPVFERLQIDYCCHGGRSLAEACSIAGITTHELLELIESTPRSEEVQVLDGMTLTAMMSFIVDMHHGFTRSTLETLQTLGVKVREHHGPRHPELVAVEKLIQEMTIELIPHMMKEEQVLFPYIKAMENATENGLDAPVPFFGTVRNPIRTMMLEHETVGEKMAEVRALTNDFKVPADGCASYTALYETLFGLEQDLHRHIHLENNILFPRAAAMEGDQQAAFVGTYGEHVCKH